MIAFLLGRTFNASNDELKESGPNWNDVVGVELYEHDDAMDNETGGLQNGCNWDVEKRNLANDKSMARTKDELRQLLREGWRGALPMSEQS